MKRILSVVVALGVLSLLVYFSWYGYLFKGVYATYLQGRTTSDPFDAAYFDTEKIPAAPQPLAWPVAIDSALEPSDATQLLLDASQTGALLVFDRDTLRHEAYFSDFESNSKVN